MIEGRNEEMEERRKDWRKEIEENKKRKEEREKEGMEE